ncbi:putative short-chain dehydrogenase/reductase family 42E member 2 isoform X1 [Nycticebus coucang]|uniref:putative short-chain dehydrogenase/reductase family 42E member 2 isoform X1 n=1 Tax=Nycticebus coucang TaxID=9470 RepID=UPI00234D59E4|nr:putative short-chain dehydrogenase/reductase family 42E member 2 isoform X1 [Nycticebus coucang]
MKPNPTGSSPEACKAAGQGEKSCPVCQACGSVSGPGSGVGLGSGPGPGPGAIPGSGLGPHAIPGRGSGPGIVSLGPGSGPGDVPGHRSGPSAVLEPRLGPRAVLGPGPGPNVPGRGEGSGAVPEPGTGPGTVPGPGPGLGPGPGPGSLPGAESVPWLRRGSGTGLKGSESMTAPTPALQQKTQAGPAEAPQQKVLVTGGGGYLGFSLGSSLARRGTPVILLDLRRPQWALPTGTEFIQADVRDETALYRAFEGVDCVFHVASYGMSGAEKHMDHYSRTKAIADQLTLLANGTPLPGGGTLRTCVLRPPGIYGPEEQRHLPRVASHIKRRLFMFRFGDRRTRMNWVHVSNLVQAHMLAAEALTVAKGYVASGQAYYINDGESVNLFEWMAPLFEKLGYSQPWIQVPTSCVYLAAAVMEHLHLALRPICSVPPLLTRSEVLNVAVTHTFQIAKARAQLGYAPAKFSFAEAVERYVQSTARRPRGSTTRALLRLLFGLLLLGLLALALYFLVLQPLQATVDRL